MRYFYAVVIPDEVEKEEEVVVALKKVLDDNYASPENYEHWLEGPSPLINLIMSHSVEWSGELLHQGLLAAAQAVDPRCGVALSIVDDEQVPWTTYGKEVDDDEEEDEDDQEDES
jgi:hypothetical protein